MQSMTTRFKIDKGRPYPLGALRMGNGINFSFVCDKEECGIILYLRGTRRHQVKLAFTQNHRIGRIACGFLVIGEEELEAYDFYAGEEIIKDPYARVLLKDGRCGMNAEKFDWGTEPELKRPYEECILYGVHVRGFTRHSSSKVKAKGTFQGIIEKIPYLTELGVTSLELMPAYEFENKEPVLIENENAAPDYFEKRYKDTVKLPEKSREEKINYWGYKEGSYFTPKRSYTYGESPQTEFKELVKNLHQNGIELIMQFYFPSGTGMNFILEILRFWKEEYHVDGFHLKGERIPIADICREPMLEDTKLLYEDFPLHELYGDRNPRTKNLAFYRDDFLYDMRRFLKGDEGMVENFLMHQRNVSPFAASIHYIANYYGFTLNDLVCYEKKHNELNGENNRDGSDYNISWNCGTEGPTRKKAVLELRDRQIRNALCFVFLSQGTPFLMSGDEFGKTQKGNNNPYCQDNNISWINWSLQEKNKDLFEFVKMLIRFRQKHPVLRMTKEFRMTDYLSCGYPDLSYHGEEPWKLNREYNSRYVGILYCGAYTEEKDAFIYILYNMHWEKHSIALPTLPKGREWTRAFSTGRELKKNEDQVSKIELEGRTVCVYIAK